MNDAHEEELSLRDCLVVLTQDRGVWRSDLDDLLRGKLRPLCAAWHIDPALGVDSARRALHGKLLGHIHQLIPRRDRQQLTPDQRKKQYEHAVVVGFNIHSRANLSNVKLQERQIWLASDDRGALKIAQTTSYKDLRHAIDEIARRITSGTEPAATSETVAGPVGDAPPVGAETSVDPTTGTVKHRKSMKLLAVASVVTLVAVSIIVINRIGAGTDSPTTSPAPPTVSGSNGAGPNVLPVSGEPPIKVEQVSHLVGLPEEPHWVFRDTAESVPSGLVEFSEAARPGIGNFREWYAKNGGMPIGQGVTTLTLRGNASETVRITSMKAVKDCSAPYDGTYFVVYTQGGGGENLKLGLDLDSPESAVRKVATLSSGELESVGNDYFLENTIDLAPKERISITLGAFTKKYGCSFVLEMDVASPEGVLRQTIDVNGEPFRITAPLPLDNPDRPWSGYKTLFAMYSDLTWRKVDPKTFEGAS